MTHAGLYDYELKTVRRTIMRKTGSVICLVAALAFALVFAVGDASAATQEPTANMAPITLSGGELWGSAIALDSSNNLYVADAYNGKVYKFDSSGAKVGEVNAANATAIEVDGSGNVLVATDYGTQVKILTSGLVDTLQALTGGPVFYEIQDIALDPATGDLYLADASSNVVSKFNSSYAHVSNVTYTTFEKPYSLTVKGSDLCVGDRPYALIISSYDNGYGDTARLRCNNKNTGVSTWQYVTQKFGYQEHMISMPAGLEVDIDGSLIWVVDPAQFALRAFDPALGDSLTAYVRYIHDVNQPMRGVTDAAISKTGVVFISSLNTHDIKRFALDGGFMVGPSALSFQDVVLNAPMPAEKLVTIENPGASAMTVSCTPSDPWIVVNATDCPGGSVSVPAAGFVEVGITVDSYDGTLTAGLPYNGAVTFTNPFGDSMDVTVAMTTMACSDAVPVLVAQPGNISFTLEEFRNGQSRVVDLLLCSDTLPIPNVSATSNNPLCTVSEDNVLHKVTITCNPGSAETSPDLATITITDVSGSPTAAPALVNVTIETLATTPRYMAVTMGPDAINDSGVLVLNTDSAFSQDFAFTAYDAATVSYGGRPSMGDVDGDNLQEIIVAKGSNEANNAEIKVFKLDGTPLTGANLVAFSTAMTSGARLAAGDLAGDGYDEVVVGSATTGSLLRVFSYDPAGKTLDDTGLMLNPGFATSNTGVNVAVMDLNLDGVAEILTAPSSKTAAPEVKAWSVDSSAGLGAWTVAPYSFGGAAIESPLAGVLQGGAAIAAGMSKVAVGSGYTNNSTVYGLVEVYNADGSLCSTINHNDPNSRLASGIEIAVGDVDNDGMAEVLISGGANPASDSTISIYDVEDTGGCIVSPGAPTSTLGPVFGPALYGAKTALGTWQ